MNSSYNDIQEWKYKDLVPVFGADPNKSKTYQVKTKQEAEDLFNDEKFSSAPYLQVCGPSLLGFFLSFGHTTLFWDAVLIMLFVVQLVELYMPKEDAPKALKLTTKASAETNAKQ